MDRKTTIIVCLTVILISILAAITYISYFTEPKMETVNLNTASIDVPSRIDFKKIEGDSLLLNSSAGYFVEEFTGNVTLKEIQDRFGLTNNSLISQRGSGDANTSKVMTYRMSEDSYIGVYVTENSFIVVGAPNENILNVMLNSIEPFSSVVAPAVADDGESTTATGYQYVSDDSSDDDSSQYSEFFEELNSNFLDSEKDEATESDENSILPSGN